MNEHRHPVYPYTNERTGRTVWLTPIQARAHNQAPSLRQQSHRPNYSRSSDWS